MFVAPKLNVADDATERIAKMIRTGKYPPGSLLPSERALTVQLKVSRTSVREALHRLETMGLLESRPGLGTFVQDPSRQVLQAAFVPQVLTNQTTLAELFDLREMIEVEAAGRAAQHATEAQIEAIRHWAKEVEARIARNDQEGHILADVEFHRQIIIATGNNILVNLMDSISGLLREMRFASSNIPELFPQVIQGHRAILKAIAAHDSEAARRAMQKHLAGVGKRVKRFWARQDGRSR